MIYDPAVLVFQVARLELCPNLFEKFSAKWSIHLTDGSIPAVETFASFLKRHPYPLPKDLGHTSRNFIGEFPWIRLSTKRHEDSSFVSSCQVDMWPC